MKIKKQENIAIETFKNPNIWLRDIQQNEISCFNSIIRIEKYKVTIEKIEEPIEVLQQRIQYLWDVCDNHHHVKPIKERAKKLNYGLKGIAGCFRKK